jgi:putative radical SAM enzyme (TIGR03279 family)
LHGNYITLTNLSERETERICRLKIGPLGVSVHTTAPSLRVRMLRNKRAGECLSIMRRFAGARVPMNAQIVLCPGYNDGAALEQTLRDLQTLGGMLISTSIVPVGLTCHREGLTDLRPVTREDALAAIETATRFPNVWCSDEMFLRAGLPVPPAESYGDFPQFENGVGMLALFEEEWENPQPSEDGAPIHQRERVTVATGLAAAPFLTGWLKPFKNVTVVPVENRFFGSTVDAAGLLTGSDLQAGLAGKDLGGRVFIPSSMLRRGGDVFLDDMTVAGLAERLGVPVVPVEPDAEGLRRVLT